MLVRRLGSSRSTTAFVMGAIIASVALAASACSDDGESKFAEEGPPTTSDDGQPPPFAADSGLDGTSGDASGKCDPRDGGAAPTWTAPTKQSVCAADDLTAYFDACIASLGKPDGGGTCDAWKAANTACGACIEPTDNSGPIQWFKNRFYQTVNVAGCLELTQTSLPDCGEAYNAAVSCKRDACEGCFSTGLSTFKDFLECQGSAGSSVCATYEADQGTKCAGARDTAPTSDCFQASGESQKIFFARVEGIFCGP